MLAVAAVVACADLLGGDAEVQHGLPGHDIQILRVATAEILGMVGRVRGWILGHGE
jgi:hypothetical protein